MIYISLKNTEPTQFIFQVHFLGLSTTFIILQFYSFIRQHISLIFSRFMICFLEYFVKCKTNHPPTLGLTPQPLGDYPPTLGNPPQP